MVTRAEMHPIVTQAVCAHAACYHWPFFGLSFGFVGRFLARAFASLAVFLARALASLAVF